MTHETYAAVLADGDGHATDTVDVAPLRARWGLAAADRSRLVPVSPYPRVMA